MSDYVTKQDLKDSNVHLEKVIRSNTDEILGIIQTFMAQVDERFNRLESRVDDIDKRLDRLTIAVDKIVGRIDSYETELKARDHKIARLEKYIEVLAKKADVDLESIRI